MELRLPLMYLFAMPRWAPLHRAISVVLLACPGVLLLAGGGRDVRVHGIAVGLLALAVGVAAKLRIAEWGAALLSLAVIGLAFWEWAWIFLRALDGRLVSMNGNGTIGYAALTLLWPMLVLISLAVGRWRRPSARAR